MPNDGKAAGAERASSNGIAFGILATHVLWEAWRFQTWPEWVRSLSIAGFCGFMAADIMFAVWWLCRRPEDDTKA